MDGRRTEPNDRDASWEAVYSDRDTARRTNGFGQTRIGWLALIRLRRLRYDSDGHPVLDNLTLPLQRLTPHSIIRPHLKGLSPIRSTRDQAHPLHHPVPRPRTLLHRSSPRPFPLQQFQSPYPHPLTHQLPLTPNQIRNPPYRYHPLTLAYILQSGTDGHQTSDEQQEADNWPKEGSL